MTTDDILRAAIECQLITTGNRDGVYAASLVRFATLIRAAALAEQPAEQSAEHGEPVAWRVWRGDAYELFFSKYAASQRADCFTKRPDVEPLYASPQTAKQPLTDAEIDSLWAAIPNQALYKAVRAFARAIENVILGVKNNGSV